MKNALLITLALLVLSYASFAWMYLTNRLNNGWPAALILLAHILTIMTVLGAYLHFFE